MKNYIQRIIRLFAASDPDKKVTGEIHQWLLDQEHTEEKETALHDLWNETEGKVDQTTWTLSHQYIPKSEPTPEADISHASVLHITRLP